MGTTVEIAYYNTFALAGGESEGTWHVEESRIKGGFNNTSVDFGVKAYLVDDEYSPRVRENAMIYSGVFNAKTKVNNTNQFAINEPITKAVDVANGSIQKLDLVGNVTGLTFTNITAGSTVSLILRQDAIGFRRLNTTSFASNWTIWDFVGNHTTLTVDPLAYDGQAGVPLCFKKEPDELPSIE